MSLLVLNQSQILTPLVVAHEIFFEVVKKSLYLRIDAVFWLKACIFPVSFLVIEVRDFGALL